MHDLVIRGATIADGTGFARLALAEKFKLQSVRRHDDELFTVFSRV